MINASSGMTIPGRGIGLLLHYRFGTCFECIGAFHFGCFGVQMRLHICNHERIRDTTGNFHSPAVCKYY